MSLLSWCAATPALAQVNVDRFVPALDETGFVGLTGTPTPGHLRWELSFAAGYLHHPVPEFGDASGGSSRLLSRRGFADLEGEIGLGDRAAVAIGLPGYFAQGGETPDGFDGFGGPSSGVGDPRVTARYRLFGDVGVEGRPPDGPGVGVDARLQLPLASDDSLAGDGDVSGELGATLDFHLLGAGAGLRVALLHRTGERSVIDDSARDALVFAGGLRSPLPMFTPLVVALECRGRTDFDGAATTPIELDLGLRLRHEGFIFMLAGGLGLTDAIGAPGARALLGVRYRPVLRDKDGDGIEDDVDQCPLLPEDLDGFQDEDGCEDPDNDNDWIPDVDDLCPNEEALEGQDENEDGCTD